MSLRNSLPFTLRNRSPLKSIALAMTICLLSAPAHAGLKMGAPFGEHMVLPRDVPVTLWGTGAPAGDTVRVAIQGQTAEGHADWDGRWLVQLKPLRAGGPFQLNVAIGGLGPIVPTPAANATVGLEVNDVLVGDVLSLSQLTDSKPRVQALPSTTAATLPASLHPYAFVRVYIPASPTGDARWSAVRQDFVPLSLEPAFAAGGAFAAQTHLPVGVLQASPPTRCPPSTACSAH